MFVGRSEGGFFPGFFFSYTYSLEPNNISPNNYFVVKEYDYIIQVLGLLFLIYPVTCVSVYLLGKEKSSQK